MTETSLDQLGPVDYVVVEFPAGASNFTGEMATELVRLVNSGTIRLIDVLILTKNKDGTVDATELSDIDELGELQALEAQLAELLAAEDVAHLAAAMDPGSTAGVLIWENLWAAPFAAAARRSGGQLIANGRIPIQAIIASIEADEATRDPKETEHAAQTSTCRKSRRHRRTRREDGGRRGSRHTWPVASRENRGRGRGRHTRAAVVGESRLTRHRRLQVVPRAATCLESQVVRSWNEPVEEVLQTLQEGLKELPSGPSRLQVAAFSKVTESVSRREAFTNSE